MTLDQQFEEIVGTARSGDAIVGLILYASRAAGMFVREDSDWECVAHDHGQQGAVTRPAAGLTTRRTAQRVRLSG